MAGQGALTRSSPVDRGKTGSKHHLLTDASPIPLAIAVTGADRNDVTQLLALVDEVVPVRGRISRPRQPGCTIFRRLRIRWERRPEVHEAYLHLGCVFICHRYLIAWRSPARGWHCLATTMAIA